LNPVNDTTTTGTDGSYFFKNLVPQEYSVEVSKPPYATTTKGVMVTSANTVNVNFHMHTIQHPELSRKYLDFGLDSTQSFFTIKNTGTGTLHYTLTATQDWMTLNRTVGDISTGTDTIEVSINRTGLSLKKHIENIEIASKVGDDYIKDNVKVFINGVIDEDGNYYGVVMIGTQIWMAENLNTGNKIPHNTNQRNNGIPEKYYANDDEELGKNYGGLYQWGESMKYQPSDAGIIGTTQGICPAGWHIPTINEFDSLRIGHVAGNLWADRGNETGFSALPAGYYADNQFWEVGVATSFSTSAILDNKVVEFYLASGFTTLGPDPSASPQYSANYIRCIKDPAKSK